MNSQTGSEFFNDPTVFETYQNHRKIKQNPNSILELPIIESLLPALGGKVICDLGCGDGSFDRHLVSKGAKEIIGIDGSQKMIAFAQQDCPKKIKFVRADIEAFNFPENKFDLVVSRLALHYLKNLKGVFQKIYRSLKRDGLFLFSVEHPCLTAGPTDWTSYKRGSGGNIWPVDRYFHEGKRNIFWMGKTVRKYHRTLETYFSLLATAGFQIKNVCESRPRKDLIEDEALYERLCRMPLFLFFRATK